MQNSTSHLKGQTIAVLICIILFVVIVSVLFAYYFFRWMRKDSFTQIPEDCSDEFDDKNLYICPLCRKQSLYFDQVRRRRVMYNYQCINTNCKSNEDAIIYMERVYACNPQLEGVV